MHAFGGRRKPGDRGEHARGRRWLRPVRSIDHRHGRRRPNCRASARTWALSRPGACPRRQVGALFCGASSRSDQYGNRIGRQWSPSRPRGLRTIGRGNYGDVGWHDLSDEMDRIMLETGLVAPGNDPRPCRTGWWSNALALMKAWSQRPIDDCLASGGRPMLVLYGAQDGTPRCRMISRCETNLAIKFV
jgi:hypothetical protein